MTMKSEGRTEDLRQSILRHDSPQRKIARRAAPSEIGLGLLNQTMRSPRPLALAILCMVALGATEAAGAINRAAAPSCASDAERPIYAQVGLASWYGGHAVGRRTASGEPLGRHALTAAHRTLPFGSIVRVTNLENWRAVVVTINDRGPNTRRNHGRIIDLSKPAALALGITRAGLTKIKLEEFKSAQPAG
jgi:rare lipoprotein A